MGVSGGSICGGFFGSVKRTFPIASLWERKRVSNLLVCVCWAGKGEGQTYIDRSKNITTPPQRKIPPAQFAVSRSYSF